MKEKMEKNKQEIKVGDRVVYKNVVANVDRISTVFSGEYRLLSLTAIEDEEMTCTAKESECEIYSVLTFDEEAQADALSDARFESAIIQRQVGNLTDKHFR